MSPHRRAAAGDDATTDSALAANVVDVRRFSTHDGRGIRTTIFLKGCPLACSWCQNPEAIAPRIRPVFFRSRCIDCGLCLGECAAGAATRDADGKVRIDTTVVGTDWEVLSAGCPSGAITFDARRYTVAELVGLVERDRVFFGGGGGGVTLSGGEPLFLPRFATALLRALKRAGLDTAVETALDVRPGALATALPWTDHLLADCKLIDADEHRRHTGRPNRQILANLAGLLTGDRRADVIVRTPLIPGVTATPGNIAGIARFISGLYPEVRYELLNYNPLAAAKYDLLPGAAYLFPAGGNPPMFTRDQLAGFGAIARAAGVRNLVAA
ncbi:MAG: glycyl-radical enzyme activating protein [Propionicimonas sp.]|nr:glycyl-radical enzyme activating protein [Propionicimonas sp.]